jgi:hypothetical protein
MGRSPKPEDHSSKVRRRQQGTDLGDDWNCLLIQSQERMTEDYLNGARRDEGSRVDSARDIYKPVQSLGEENPPDPVSDLK